MSNDYERAQKAAAQQAVRVLSDYVNNMGHDPKAFVEALSREHRTLQQSATSLMLAWFEHLSKLEDGWYDLRNEASVQVAKKIWPVIEANYSQRLPLI
jgi:hypothetical protein